MLKESILFVASTGLLIYFIAPSDEPAAPVKQQVQQPAKPAVETPDDGWGYEDEGDGEEEAYADDNFTFGEPMTLVDDDSAGDSQAEDDPSDRPEQPDNSRTRSKSSGTSAAIRSAVRVSPNSPRAGEPGSPENPIVFKTNNPTDPADD